MVKYSVITPTYNRKKELLRCINSVVSQNYDDFEMVICDDGSTDGTEEIVAMVANLFQQKIVYFNQAKNTGVNGARNAAIKKATGEYMIILDSDDLFVPDGFNVLDKIQLDDINFFQVQAGEELLSHPQVVGKVTYRDWLSGKIAGEYLPVVHKRVYDYLLYDEGMFCFESYYWNKVIRKFGLTVHLEMLRRYTYDADNRISKQLHLVKNAPRRYADYKKYCEAFKRDYFDNKLRFKYYGIMLRRWLYWWLKCLA